MCCLYAFRFSSFMSTRLYRAYLLPFATVLLGFVLDFSQRHWYQFYPGSFTLTPCFIPKGLGSKLSELQFEKMSNELLDKVTADLTAFRASRNLNTKWNRDEVLEAFLQT